MHSGNSPLLAGGFLCVLFDRREFTQSSIFVSFFAMKKEKVKSIKRRKATQSIFSKKRTVIHTLINNCSEVLKNKIHIFKQKSNFLTIS